MLLPKQRWNIAFSVDDGHDFDAASDYSIKHNVFSLDHASVSRANIISLAT
jgi:hypothetical protein